MAVLPSVNTAEPETIAEIAQRESESPVFMLNLNS